MNFIEKIKTDCYGKQMIYRNLMVTTNQKSMKDMQRTKRKETKYSTKQKQQIAWKKRSREEGTEENYKINLKTMNKMAINIYLSIITLSVIVLNAPTKRRRVA